MITMCCKCKKIKSEQGWMYRLLPVDMLISHGYCPECYLQALEEIEQCEAARAA